MYSCIIAGGKSIHCIIYFLHYGSNRWPIEITLPYTVGTSISPTVSPTLPYKHQPWPSTNQDALPVSQIQYPPKPLTKRRKRRKPHTVLPPKEIPYWATDVPHYNYEGTHADPATNIPSYFYSQSTQPVTTGNG